MAHITLAGVLLDPTGEFSVGDKVKFTHQSTTGNTIKSAVSVITVPPNGAYSINLEYGLVLVEYNDYRIGQYRNLGVATVNATNTATSIPELLNALVPASSAELIQFQAILANAVTAQNAASASASASASSATDSANSAASADWASIRYSKLDNPLVHLFKKNKIVETLSGALTWTRATTATYVDRYGVLKTAAVDEPREEKEGSLIEGASTNNILFSSNIDASNAGWNTGTGGTGVTAATTPNFAIAPDDSMTASRIQLDKGAGTTSGDQASLNAVYTNTIGLASTASIYLKANVGNPTVRLDFNGALPDSGDALVTLTNAWVRHTITLDSTVDTGRRLTISLRGTQGTSDTADFLAWGAQEEALPFASSYIPTTSSPATRAADDCRFPVRSNLPNGEFSIYFSLAAGVSDGSFPDIVRWTTNGGGARIEYRASNKEMLVSLDGGVNVFGSGNQADINGVYAFTFDADGNSLLYKNGSSIGSQSASGTNNPVATGEIKLMLQQSGEISDFRIYDFALNTAEANFLSGE
jgi:hypothetical protein